MLTRINQLAVPAMALLSVWLAGAVVLRLMLGTNYPGSTVYRDIFMNLGIVLFFFISSGFIITYTVKTYYIPPRNFHNIALSIILIATHCLLYAIFFLRMPLDKTFLLVAIGMVCVALVESVIYLAVFRRGTGN